MEAVIQLIVNLFFPLLILAIGYGVGKIAESRHYKSIRARERGFLHIPAIASRTLDDPRGIQESKLALGAVVVSVDHYKRFLMFFRKIFGGEIRSYSPLVDRGRREAILRMKESCPDADLYLNCRLETSTIHSGKGKATGCVEVVAYATAIKFAE